MAGDDAMSKVTLTRPAAGETVHVDMRKGHVYLLEFDLGETTVADNGKDVLLTFDDGSGMVLRDFFFAAKAGDFYLTLPDGVMLSGKDVVESLAFSPENFHPSEDCAFAEAHDGISSSLAGAEAGSLSGLPRGTRCELSAGHDGSGLPFSPEALDEADLFASGRESNVCPPSLAHGPEFMSGDIASSFPPFSLHGGRSVPHLDDLLDMPVPPVRGHAPGDLESLLPPVAPPVQSSLPDAHQEGESGKVPPDNAAAHSFTPVVSSADSGGESQDQHLLTQLFLLSL